MVTFTQFGSCVSRDIFNFLDELEFCPICSHNCINISTIVKESKLMIFDSDIVANNDFEFRIQKLLFEHPDFRTYMRNVTSDYFIFDLGGERLPLQKWEYEAKSSQIPVTWNTYRTSKNVLNNKYYGDGIQISDWHLADRNIKNYEEDIEEYCKIILEKYDPNHVIYLSVRQAKEFINNDKKCISNFNDYEGNGIEKASLRSRQDLVISRAEAIVRKNIPDMWEIVIPENSLADDRHHFRRHTLHFNHIIYDYFSECVQLIAKDRDISESQKTKIKRAIDLRKKYAEIKLEDLRAIYS